MKAIIVYALIVLDLPNLAAFLLCIPLTLLLVFITKGDSFALKISQFTIGHATILLTCLLLILFHEPIHCWVFIIPWALMFITPYPGRHILTQSIGMATGIATYYLWPV